MPIVVIPPSEIIVDDSLALYRFDGAQKVKQFLDTGKYSMAIPRFKSGQNFLHLQFKGEVSGKGINVMMFQKKAVYSFALLLDPEYLESFLKLEQWLTDYCNEIPEMTEYEQTTFVHDDRIYIRLKTCDKNLRFITPCNIKLNPKRIEDANVYQGQEVTVKADVGVYFNFDTKKTGVNLGLKEITFAE